jgi:hypothetical protein
MTEHPEAYLRAEYPKALDRIAKARAEIRNLKGVIRSANAYIELLELRLNGVAVSYAEGDPKSRLVPVGWYLGLKEENAMLRSKLAER